MHLNAVLGNETAYQWAETAKEQVRPINPATHQPANSSTELSSLEREGPTPQETGLLALGFPIHTGFSTFQTIGNCLQNNTICIDVAVGLV